MLLTEICDACGGTGKKQPGDEFDMCGQCIGTGRVATNVPGMCRQCGKRPKQTFFKDRGPARVCFECGMLNLARSFESDLGPNPTLKDISDGEQAGAFFRQFLPKTFDE